MNYKAVVQYDGTRYEGWQRHAGKETIQGKIEKALEKVTGQEVPIIGAGRTDAGVHAKGQVINFHLPAACQVNTLEKEINEALPDDIFVMDVEETDNRFHSRFHAKRKTYVYRIRISSQKDVFYRRFIWQYGHMLDIQAMEKAIPYLIGTHDFTSFRGQKKMKKSAVRTIFSIEIKEKKGILTMAFTGDGFLPYMIRILVGTLVEIGEGKRDVEGLTSVIDAKERAQAGFTAPPQGLTLLSVEYE